MTKTATVYPPARNVAQHGVNYFITQVDTADLTFSDTDFTEIAELTQDLVLEDMNRTRSVMAGMQGTFKGSGGTATAEFRFRMDDAASTADVLISGQYNNNEQNMAWMEDIFEVSAPGTRVLKVEIKMVSGTLAIENDHLFLRSLVV